MCLAADRSGVDVEPILANAAQADNGTERAAASCSAISVRHAGDRRRGRAASRRRSLSIAYEHRWRGTRRKVDLYFEVVQELGLRSACAAVAKMRRSWFWACPSTPRAGSPANHLAHARDFNDENASGGVVWQPSYLSGRAMRDLGTLVRIDFLLAGAGEPAGPKPRGICPRATASRREPVLRSQQSALEQRIRSCLEAAYGIRPDNDGCLGATVAKEDQLVSLDGTFRRTRCRSART